jgi:hypothetical protein
MRRAHLVNSLTIAIVGTNPITIVAQGGMEVCDAAHCLEVIKTSAQTNSGYLLRPSQLAEIFILSTACCRTDGIR